MGTGDRRLRERYAAAGAADLVQPTESDWVPASPRFVAAIAAAARPGPPPDDPELRMTFLVPVGRPCLAR